MNKRPKSSLTNLFKELGFDESLLDAPDSVLDAQMMAEEEGGGVTYADRPEYEKCGSKCCYPSQREADRTARRRLSRGALPLRSYFCEDCKHYHLTSRCGK